MTTSLRVYHSPDADDRFMFWPLREGLVKTRGFSFSFFEADTQALNETASQVQPEVCAISAIHYGRVHAIYQPLLMGASVGSGYGPVVVCPNGQAARHGAGIQQSGTTLLTPGLKTTAHAIVCLLGHRFSSVEVVPIAPMERVFTRLHELAAEQKPVVALLIHEGRLIYKNFDATLLFDVGERWTAQTGALLPLGINVIHRGLPLALRQDLSELLQESCRYAFEHRDEYISMATMHAESMYHTPLNARELSAYLDMYANMDTLRASQKVQDSFRVLIERAVQHGLIEKTRIPIRFDWI